eukprot:s1158_g5.t1
MAGRRGRQRRPSEDWVTCGHEYGNFLLPQGDYNYADVDDDEDDDDDDGDDDEGDGHWGCDGGGGEQFQLPSALRRARAAQAPAAASPPPRSRSHADLGAPVQHQLWIISSGSCCISKPSSPEGHLRPFCSDPRFGAAGSLRIKDQTYNLVGHGIWEDDSEAATM